VSPSAATRQSVAVVVGPGSTVDPGNIVRWCHEWAAECSVGVEVVLASGEEAVLAALDSHRLGGFSGVVLGPGDLAASSDVARAASDAAVPVAWVELEEAERPRPPYLELATTSIRGRGATGYRWALLHLLQRLDWPYEVIPYGPEGRDQVADLRLPGGPGPHPVAVLLHGGFWRERWERDTIEPLAVDLTRRGFATWNVEYRRVGPYGGGWPNTCEDVALALDHLAELAGERALDLDRIVLIGHSAGGHLALWATTRSGAGTRPKVRPGLVVSLAGVADLVECARRGLGDTGNAAEDFVGGPPESEPESYSQASPMQNLPLGVRQLVVQGRLDNTPDLVDLTHRYVRASRDAGDPVELLEFDDADHFDLIDPGSPAWRAVLARMADAYPALASAEGARRGPLDYPAAPELASRVRDAAAELPAESPPWRPPH
jgi:acetyl esterase/lipase/3-dehydroquinate dehydratase